MRTSLKTKLDDRGLTRRHFLKLATASAAAAAIPSVITGCAKNPVTGKSQLMFMSKEDEISADRQYFQHQLEADNGPVQDSALNDYVSQVGMKEATLSHRPDMPYSFRVTNANYINGYTFPGGSVAASRGLILELENEAELAALWGHEIGHVNARHAASRQAEGILLSVLVLGGSIWAGSKYGGLGGQAVQILGGFAAGALLMSYSRDDERQADALGMEYTTRAGLSPQGMIGLHEILVSMQKKEPTLLETMFSTHPMSSERLATAKNSAATTYAQYAGLPLHRERFMDNTARLRKIAGAIKTQQKGQKELGADQPHQAEKTVARALTMAPNDYTGLLLMSQCQIALKNTDKAVGYASKAMSAYPNEPKANQILGLARFMDEDYDRAYTHFSRYDAAVPGDPQMLFLRGVSAEGSGDQRTASQLYSTYIRKVQQGEQAQYAYSRLQSWNRN